MTDVAPSVRDQAPISGWSPDRLLPGYEAATIDLSEEPTIGTEPPGSLRATLLRRAGARVSNRRAVLFIHGWNDYFFHTHLADFFDSVGIDFYAVDLRRYGRSLVAGQYAGYVDAVSSYGIELDAAFAHISVDHETVSVLGHSTGGLVAALWADDRPGAFEAVMLNSPWLELQASSWLRQVSRPVLSTLSSANPLYPLPIADNGFYRRATHASEDGEWNYDLNLKGDPAFKVRTGWFNAILAGHRRVAAGLTIDAPVLVMTSARSDFRKDWHDDLKRADVVLDVDQIAARAPLLGHTVTLERVPGGAHDLFLSESGPRADAFARLRRWMTGYLPSA